MFPETVRSHFSRKKTAVYLHHTVDQELKIKNTHKKKFLKILGHLGLHLTLRCKCSATDISKFSVKKDTKCHEILRLCF